MEFAINRGLKFQIYPTEEQKVKIIQNFGYKRFIFKILPPIIKYCIIILSKTKEVF